MRNHPDKEKFEKMMAMMRDYPLRITLSDGKVVMDTIPSMHEAFALRHFDEMFMALHSTRRLYATVPDIVDNDMSYFAKTYESAVRIELLDYLSDVVLASYEITYEKGGSE